ncbi:unnamed protein product, partial [Discosporangium mesarthrocarpum]
MRTSDSVKEGEVTGCAVSGRDSVALMCLEGGMEETKGSQEKEFWGDGRPSTPKGTSSTVDRQPASLPKSRAGSVFPGSVNQRSTSLDRSFGPTEVIESESPLVVDHRRGGGGNSPYLNVSQLPKSVNRPPCHPLLGYSYQTVDQSRSPGLHDPGVGGDETLEMGATDCVPTKPGQVLLFPPPVMGYVRPEQGALGDTLYPPDHRVHAAQAGYGGLDQGLYTGAPPFHGAGQRPLSVAALEFRMGGAQSHQHQQYQYGRYMTEEMSARPIVSSEETVQGSPCVSDGMTTSGQGPGAYAGVSTSAPSSSSEVMESDELERPRAKDGRTPNPNPNDRNYSDIGLVVGKTKILENILRESFGASGNGLNDMLMSLNLTKSGKRIDIYTQKRLRSIAHMRNKLVHSVDTNSLRDSDTFGQSTRMNFNRLVDELVVTLNNCARQGVGTEEETGRPSNMLLSDHPAFRRLGGNR